MITTLGFCGRRRIPYMWVLGNIVVLKGRMRQCWTERRPAKELDDLTAPYLLHLSISALGKLRRSARLTAHDQRNQRVLANTHNSGLSTPEANI